MSVAVLIPTRGRPHNVRELLDAWDTHTVDATPVFGVDEDQLGLYEPVLAGQVVEVMPRRPLVPKLNTMAGRWAGRCDVLGFMGDDHRPRTGRWDRQVAAALAEPGIAYCDDLLRGVELPTAVFMSTGIVKALGYMAPPTLEHFYCDNAWRDWGIHAGCLRYLPGVIVEHVHHENGKADKDDGYRSIERHWEGDMAAYDAYLHERLNRDVAKVRVCVSG